MRQPLSPMEAYTVDVGEGARWAGHPTQPHGWFSVTHVAHRVAALPEAQREWFLATLPDGLLPEAGRRPTHIDHGTPAPAHPVAIAAEQFRVAAEDMERDGCFEMAYTTVSAAARLATRHDAPSALSAANHLARIMRQLGETRIAEELHEGVASEARHRGYPSVAGYALAGLGNLAMMRGNRPAQVRYYMEALALAPSGTALESAVRWGLMNHALAVDSLPDALVHGWRAYDLSDTDEARAGILGNLASVAFRARFLDAAVAGFTGALAMATSARLWLSIASTAAEAAGVAGRTPLLSQLEETGRGHLASAGPFESSQWLLGLATGWHAAGDADRTERFAKEAQALAKRHEFHEVAYRAEALVLSTPVQQPSRAAVRESGPILTDLPFSARDGLSRLRAMAG